MREFNKISAKYWITNLSRKLKGFGSDTLLVSIYLQTNHHTHSLGIFYLPINYIAQDVGINAKKVKSIVENLVELDFCQYDFEQEYIWLKGYALEQSGGALKAGDNRVSQLQKYFEDLPALSFIEDFYQIHKDDFHLTHLPKQALSIDKAVGPVKGVQSPLKGSSKDLQSTETETQTETKTERETEIPVALTRPEVQTKPIQKIFEHWQQTMNHPKAKLDNKRKRLILQALQLGYDCEQLCDAITGCSLTPHNVGDNDRGERYDGLHVILRNADQIDRFIRNSHEPPKRLSKTLQQSKQTYHALEGWMNGDEEVGHGIC